MPEKKVAVTGANGFVGAHCVLELLEHGYNVVAIIRDPSDADKTEFLKEEATKLGKGDKLSFRSGDLLIDDSYDDSFEGCWGVVHAAAQIPTQNFDDPYESIVKPAVDGTRNIVSSVKKNSHTIKRFVNISSVAAIVSSDKSKGHTFTDEDWNTASTVEKGDAYGYAKTTAEKSVWDDEELRSKIDVIVSLNPSVILGKVYNKNHATMGSPKFVQELMSGKPVMGGTGFQLTFVHVRDVSKGVLSALEKDKDVVDGQRFILNETPPLNMEVIHESIKKVYEKVPDIKVLMSDNVFGTVLWIGRNIPFLRKPLQYTPNLDDFAWKDFQYDNTKSKDKLGIEYRSLDDMTSDAVESIKQYLEDDESK